MKLSRLLFAAVLVIVSGGCKRDRAPEEALLESAFNAFRNHDWQAMKQTIVSSADFDLAAQAMTGPFKAQLSYSSNLKKEEFDEQEKLFAEALEGGEQLIDFENSEFIGLGRLIAEGERPTLSGRSIHVKTFSLKVRDRKSGKQSDDLLPYLALVSWKGKPRVVSIILPPEEEEEPAATEELDEASQEAKAEAEAVEEELIEDAGSTTEASAKSDS